MLWESTLSNPVRHSCPVRGGDVRGHRTSGIDLLDEDARRSVAGCYDRHCVSVGGQFQTARG